MSDTPWVDLPSKQQVKNALLGGKSSTGTKYSDLVEEIAEYHRIPKDEYQQFLARASKLQAVRRHALYAESKESSKAYQDFLYKLVVRAAEKAMYLEETYTYLTQHHEEISDLLGYLDRMSQRRPVVPPPPVPQGQGWQTGRIGSQPFGIQGGVLFEKEDKYHREFEVTFPEGYGNWQRARGGAVGQYMVEWARMVLNDGYTKPFLAFLETTRMCNWEEGWMGSGLRWQGVEKMGQVQYSKDGELVEGTAIVKLGQDGRLHETKQGGQTLQFDTTHVTEGKGSHARAMAYVWTMQGDFIVGIHVGGKIHHTSLNGGGLVQCAGMIGATAGLVRHVDPNSGHYRPDAAHFHALVKWLDQHGLFTDDANTVVNGDLMSIKAYLANPPRSLFGGGFTIGSHRG